MDDAAMRGSYQGIVPLRVLGLRALRQETVPAQRAPGFLHLPPVGALPRTPNEGWWPAHARCSCLGCDRLLLVLGHSALCPMRIKLTTSVHLWHDGWNSTATITTRSTLMTM
ncbi:MAG: hypothetical protein SH847_00365, partial [Roseiflexaceae bacterium]|nr:hypothetical protein [Roseiflexaceae bacterium]